MTLRRPILVLTALILSACSGAVTVVPDADTGRLDGSADIAADTSADIAPIGTRCSTDADCGGGTCLSIGRCTRPCMTRTDCPVGPNWRCAALDGGGSQCSCSPNGPVEVPCNGVDDDCDGIIDNGSVTCNGRCFDPQTDRLNCGACGNVCPVPPGTAVSCTSGRCEWACLPGRGDCNGDPSDGCEVDLTTTATSCGACGHACALPNATSRCVRGVCVVDTCDDSFRNCNGMDSDGCETGILADVLNCGACLNRCSVRNGSPSCVGGICHLLSCSPNFANCDGLEANGCETSLLSIADCGGCGHACTDPTPLCLRSTCGSLCSTGAECAGSCVDLRTESHHCGGCSTACPAGPNAIATCVSSTCGFVCEAGYYDCDGVAINGCEIAPNDSANCGGCGRTCAVGPNSTSATCNAGHCNLTCSPGFGDCDTVSANGCEADLTADALHCGGCSTACPAGHSCVSGMCS